MPSKSKLWEYLSGGQFLIKGFDISFRLDQNRNGNYMGFMVFIRSDIPAKVFFTDGERFESLSV